MSPLKSSSESPTPESEELAQVQSELEDAIKLAQRLRDQAADAHRQSAIWCKAAVELTRILGEQGVEGLPPLPEILDEQA